MEGGVRGLVIVICTFLIQGLLFGTSACIGVYTVALVRYFNGNVVGVSLVSAIYYAMFFGTGPIVSMLLSWLTFRQVSLLGSAMVVVGTFCSAFAPDLTTLYIFFGFLNGLGSCLAYIPSHTLCGMYYNRHRALTTGIVTAGGGTGGMVLPVLIETLIEEYTWRGSMIILAGIHLHLIVMSLLLLPPSHIPTVEVEVKAEPLLTGSASEAGDTEDKVRMIVGQNHGSPSEKRDVGDVQPCLQLLNDVYTDVAGASEDDSAAVPILVSEWESADQNSALEHGGQYEKTDLSAEAGDHVSSSCDVGMDKSVYLLEGTSPEDSRNGLTGLVEDITDKVKSQCIPLTLVEHDGDHSSKQHCGEYPLTTNMSSILVSRLSISIMPDSDTEFDQLNLGGPPRTKEKLRSCFQEHGHIFKSYKFVLFALSSLLGSATATVFFAFGPELVVELGSSSAKAAFYFMFVGGGSLIGSVAASLFTNFVGYATEFMIFANVILGAGLLVTPLMTGEAEYILLHLALGFSMGAINGLCLILVVRIMGVAYMGLGLGYCLLAIGVGAFLGPPAFGFVREAYNTYTPVFLPHFLD